MKKLRFSLLMLLLITSVSVFADWAPANVQASLKKLYPAANDVA